MKSSHSAVVEVTRGHKNLFHVESQHSVDIVVADAEGEIVCSYGEKNRPVFPRSAIKALQALPLIESGAADKFGFEPKHLALACSSHNGEQMHTESASQMLERAGVQETCLECGAQLPERLVDRNRLAIEGKNAEPIHNTCSGKHSGFLALAKHQNIAPKNYIDIAHPIQTMIANTLEEVTGSTHGPDNYGIDGCSIPTFEIPLDKLAIAYAKFGVGKDAGKERSKAMLRLRDACMVHPEMVGGSNRFDTDFMQFLSDRVFTKTGAEGVFTVSLPELGYGIALKCNDGTTRAAEVACAAIIESLLELDETKSKAMKRFTNPILNNWNGIEVGNLQMAKKF